MDFYSRAWMMPLAWITTSSLLREGEVVAVGRLLERLELCRKDESRIDGAKARRETMMVRN